MHAARVAAGSSGWIVQSRGYRSYFQHFPPPASALQQWVCQTTGARCPTKTGVLKNWPTTVLASYPGSGSTLLRLLIEQATGVLTGTVFKDPSLLSSQPCVCRARARAWCSAPAPPRTATAALALSCEQWKGAARATNHAWAVHAHGTACTHAGWCACWCACGLLHSCGAAQLLRAPPARTAAPGRPAHASVSLRTPMCMPWPPCMAG